MRLMYGIDYLFTTKSNMNNYNYNYRTMDGAHFIMVSRCDVIIIEQESLIH
jgi:hypothetical protein